MSKSMAKRWNIRVSTDTDEALREFLGPNKLKPGELSKFVEDAVRWRLLERTVQSVRAQHDHVDVEELQAEIDSACKSVREEILAERAAR